VREDLLQSATEARVASTRFLTSLAVELGKTDVSNPRFHEIIRILGDLKSTVNCVGYAADAVEKLIADEAVASDPRA